MLSRTRGAPLAAARVESLSDMVFGLALSIGAILLIGSPPTTGADLLNDVLGFAFSFFVIVTVWLRHTRTMAVVPIETSAALRLTLVLLFLVAIEPFLFNGLFSGFTTAPGHPMLPESVGSSAYALDLAGLAGVTAGLLVVAQREAHTRGDSALARYLVTLSQVQFTGAAIFAVSILPVFFDWEIPGTGFRLRYAAWIVGSALGAVYSSNLPRGRSGAESSGSPEA